MPDYRRAWHPGGTYFFTVNLLQRQGNDLLTRRIELLRAVVKAVLQRHLLRFMAGWYYPNTCIAHRITPGDADYATRWRLIKMDFSKALPRTERLSAVHIRRGERGIWQRRYWEHLIRDERDYRSHMDYVHINPAKHGLVKCVADWPYSTFHRMVAEGVYPANWAGGSEGELGYAD